MLPHTDPTNYGAVLPNTTYSNKTTPYYALNSGGTITSVRIPINAQFGTITPSNPNFTLDVDLSGTGFSFKEGEIYNISVPIQAGCGVQSTTTNSYIIFSATPKLNFSKGVWTTISANTIAVGATYFYNPSGSFYCDADQSVLTLKWISGLMTGNANFNVGLGTSPGYIIIEQLN